MTCVEHPSSCHKSSPNFRRTFGAGGWGRFGMCVTLWSLTFHIWKPMLVITYISGLSFSQLENVLVWRLWNSSKKSCERRSTKSECFVCKMNKTILILWMVGWQWLTPALWCECYCNFWTDLFNLTHITLINVAGSITYDHWREWPRRNHKTHHDQSWSHYNIKGCKRTIGLEAYLYTGHPQ